MPDHRSPDLRVPSSMLPPKRLFSCGLLVAALGDDLAHGASGRAELDRNHPGVADDLAAEGLHLLFGFLEVVHFDGEVMDAGAFARGLRLGGLGVGVVLHDREVDRAVGMMERGVVAHFFRLGFLESEDLLVELGGALQVVDLERDVHDAVHGVLQKCPQARNSGLSVLTSLMPSRFQTVSQSLRERATPVTGATRSRLFASTSSRLIRLSGVPPTARVCRRNSRPCFNLISTMPSRRGIA